MLLIMVMVFQHRGEVMGLSKALVCLSLVHSLIGILQFYEIAFTTLPGNFPPYGLMANRNLYGSAQVLLLPFCLYVLQGARPKWRYVTIPALLFLLTSIFLSQTRAAWIATLFIGCASTAMVLFYCPASRKKWLIGSLFTFLGTGILIALLLLSAPEGSFTQSIQERSSSIISPYNTNESDSASTPSSTASERLVIWGKTLQLIDDHKILGVGPGNWKIGIEAYGNKGLVNEYGNYVLDHAHNIYLQIAGETGIPGLILFLAFLMLIIIAGFSALKRVEENKKILLILMLCGLAAFAIDGCFSFPMERIEHVFYLLLMSGIILGLYLMHAPQKTVINVSKQRALALFALAALILFISIRKFNFETHAYQVKVYHSTNQYQDVIREVNESKNPFASLDVNGDPLQMFSAIANKQLKQYDQALAEAKLALKYNPYNARVYNTIGTIYTETYKFKNAIEAYNKALSITPKSDISLKNLAVNYFNVKDFANCLATLNKIKDGDKDSTLKQIRLIAQQQISK
ncbi:MAG: O-antigen ligase family protein [Flavisolibacter sp.]